MDIEIIIPSVLVAGDQFNLTCSITVPERLTHNLTIVRWTYDLSGTMEVTEVNRNATVRPTVRNGNTFFNNLTLNPVVTSDAREYYCFATFTSLDTADRTNRPLTVKSKYLILTFTQYSLFHT